MSQKTPQYVDPGIGRPLDMGWAQEFEQAFLYNFSKQVGFTPVAHPGLLYLSKRSLSKHMTELFGPDFRFDSEGRSKAAQVVVGLANAGELPTTITEPVEAVNIINIGFSNFTSTPEGINSSTMIYVNIRDRALPEGNGYQLEEEKIAVARHLSSNPDSVLRSKHPNGPAARMVLGRVLVPRHARVFSNAGLKEVLGTMTLQPNLAPLTWMEAKYAPDPIRPHPMVGDPMSRTA